jgi:hypothetical protein
MSELYEDLLQDSSESFEDGNYFLVTVLDLELGQQYPLQFKWKYKDGTLGKDWSAVYNITTPIKSNPNDPRLQSGDVVGGAGFIKVTWDGNDASGNPLTNIDRIDVHISGTSFGDGTKPAGSFRLSGTQTFSAEAGVYIVQLKAVTVNGATSFFSTARTVTVTAVGEVIQTPTLPSGLSVATAPFAVAVNWAGTYSSSTFTGFKSVDIYAVGSDLGSSVTSGITNTNLVGSLTVNNTPNKINVSLDNLRQALALSTNSDVYSATIFYYFNATNTDGTKFGSPTYTRINSSSVVPTKANFIDLVSGVISIENLVAGNGNFSSWLRTGTAGGARIELSAVSDFSNSGYTVQKGLTAYSSGNTEIFKLDLDSGALTINGSGTFSGSLSAASGTFTGTLSAATGSFNGTITASGGTIGGIIIAADAIQNGATSGASTFRLDSSGKARFGASGGNSIIIDPAIGVFQSTNGNSANGRFTLNATGDSTISGWTIGSSSISKGTTILSSSGTNGLIQIGSSTSFFKASSDGLQLGNETFGSAPFRVTPAGALTASSANITGTINATGGTFSGSITASGTISGGTISGAIISTNNQRIRINDTADQITFHPSSASNIGRLYMSSTSTVGQLLLEAPYNSTRAFLQMDTFGDTPSVELSASTGTVQLTGNNVRLNPTGNFFTGNLTGSESSTSTGTHLGYDGVIQARRSAATPMFSHRTDGNGRVITFFLAGSGGGGINATAGGTPTFASASDYRLKENIVDYINATDRIKAARLRKFNLKSIPNKEFVGFIAHEFVEVDPEFVIGEKDAVDENGDPVYQEIGTTNLIYYLTGALKDSIIKIEELEQRLDALEG